MAEYEKYLVDKSKHPQEIVALAEEILKLRYMLWISHGHKGIYGDDGEMQCGECIHEYGFWDWKRTDINEMESKIQKGNLKKYADWIAKERKIG